MVNATLGLRKKYLIFSTKRSVLNADMSIVSLVANADPIVKIIMFILLLTSVYSWSIIIQRVMVLRDAKAHLNSFQSEFWAGLDMSKLYASLNENVAVLSGISHLFHSGFKEFVRLRQKSTIRGDALMDGVERSMRISMTKETEKLEKQLTMLGTIGAVAPYIGLLGTVWGIMASFTVLGGVQQATLTMVAPHIAEALIATALGLFVAIPAVVAYNRLTRQVDGLLSEYENFHDEFCGILHREAYN